jgi:hypothetical protein
MQWGCKCCECPANQCEDGPWGQWSACHPSTGLKMRSRMVRSKTLIGVACPRVTEREPCWEIAAP